MAALKPPSDTLQAEDVLSQDVPCIQCAYNLHSLAVDGHCPECGEPVRYTLEGRLRHTDLPWLTRMRTGMTLYIVAWIVALGVPTLGLVYFGHPFKRPGFTMAVLFAGVLLACLVSLVAGLFLMSTPFPSPPTARMLPHLRVRLRACVAALVLVGIVTLATLPLSHPGFTTYAATIEGILILLATLALAFHLRALALWIPDHNLQRGSALVCWGLAVSLSMFILSACLFAIGVRKVVAYVALAALAVVMVFELGLLYELAEHRAAFDKAISSHASHDGDLAQSLPAIPPQASDTQGQGLGVPTSEQLGPLHPGGRNGTQTGPE